MTVSTRFCYHLHDKKSDLLITFPDNEIYKNISWAALEK